MVTGSKPYKVKISATIFPDRKPVLVFKVPKSIQCNPMRRDNGDISVKFESHEALKGIAITVDEDTPSPSPAPRAKSEKSAPAGDNAPSQAQRSLLNKMAGERDLSDSDIKSLSVETIGKPVSALTRKEFGKLIDQVKLIKRTDR